MGDTLTIQVTGLDVIERNINVLQNDLPEYLGMAGKEAASEISNSSSQVYRSAEELNKLAEELKERVSRFQL